MASDSDSPVVDSFTGTLQDDDGAAAQQPASLQIALGGAVLLSWQIRNAPDGVELTDPATPGTQLLDAGTTSYTAQPAAAEQDYVLVAIAGEDRSAPATVHVSTHGADQIVSPHASVAAPDLGTLSGTLENEDGAPLPRWPFQVLDANNNEVLPAVIARAGGSATPPPAAAGFVSDVDGSYSVSGVPARASVSPVAPLAPIDTSSGPVPATGGTPQTDGKPPNKFVTWIKAKASELEGTRAGEVVMDDAGEAVGYAELLGVRYPVKAYQAQVSSTLTRGSRLDAAGLQDLASRGFHGVVNFCKEYDDSAAVTAAGLHPLHLAVLDNTAPTYAEIKQFLDFVTNTANEPAYCHCEAGVGRTGVFCASYRIAASGFTTEAAIDEAKKYGLALSSQIQFLQRLGPDILAGKIAGYPRAS